MPVTAAWTLTVVTEAAVSQEHQGPGKLHLGEMLFTMVLFHLWPDRDFKHFRHHGVEQEFRQCVAELPAYSRP